MTKLTPTLIRLTFAHRRAERAFRQELSHMGLPGDVVDELTEAYPSVSIRDIKNARKSKDE